MKPRRPKKSRFSRRVRALTGQAVRPGALRQAECLLAFQFCDRDADGHPSEDARLGAVLMALQHQHLRELREVAFALAGVTGG